MIIAKWSGEWTLIIAGVDYSHMIPKELRISHMNTAGTYQRWYFEDWAEQFEDYEDGLDFDEWLAENPWVHNLPAPSFDIYLAFQSEDWRHGSCGGCI